MKDLVSFPVVSFSGSFVEPSRSYEEFIACSNTGFRRGWFQDLKIVDSDGTEFTVISARRKSVSPLRRLLRPILNSRERVDIELAPDVAHLSFEEVLAKLTRTIKADEYFWNSGGDLDELLEELGKSGTVPRLLQIFTERFYHEY